MDFLWNNFDAVTMGIKTFVMFAILFQVAPIMAWVATRGRLGLRLAMGWNVLGLLSLANVTASAVLTGPIKLISAEVPTVAMGFFPYAFIPGFFVPLAVTLHVLAIRAIAARLRTIRSPASGISASTS